MFTKFSWPWVDCLCSQLTVNLLESFQGVRHCGSSQAHPAQSTQWLQCDFCLQVIVYPSYLLFVLAVSVILQRDAMAVFGILALQISFPTPFTPNVLINVFLFCSLSNPISTHSYHHFIFRWCWEKIMKCAWLNRSYETGPFSGHLFRAVKFYSDTNSWPVLTPFCHVIHGCSLLREYFFIFFLNF